MTQLLAGLAQDLDRVHDDGRAVSVWWRDDDAVRASAALERLLALAASVEAPLAIAAIPALVEPSLPERLSALEDVVVIAHGLTHADHAPAGEKSAEFGPHRASASMQADLARSLALTRAAFADRALPVFVPPWNRIGEAAAAALPGVGYRAVSAFAGGGPSATVPGCPRVDTHLDPVDWRGGRSLLAPGPMAAALRRALDCKGPVGLLTHHLAFDERLWSFTRDLVELFARHPAVRLVSVASLLRKGTGSSSARLLSGGDEARRRSRPEYAT